MCVCVFLLSISTNEDEYIIFKKTKITSDMGHVPDPKISLHNSNVRSNWVL